MRRLVTGVSVLLLLAVASPSFALITALTPLSLMLDNSAFVFTATVDELDPDRPSMSLKLDAKLKGKPGFDKMSALLVGDKGAVKRKESPKLLERLDKKLSVVVFVFDDGKGEYEARVYTNGTWFTLRGVTVEKEIRWSFVCLEPYLRRTYKGTTKEMVETVEAALAKKKDPPKPDEKEKPGLGDPVKKGCDECEPQYGVVPTVLIGGPLVMLAMLFPTAFGGWKRWLVLLSTAGTNSTLYTLQWWFADSLAGTWLGSTATLWATMGVVNVIGVAWAWQRHAAMVQAGTAPGRPGLVEILVLVIVSVIGLVGLATLRALDQNILSDEWLPLLSFCLAMWLGCAYVLYARFRPARMTPAVATEAVVLVGLAISGIALGTTMQAKSTAGKFEADESLRVVWKFRLPAAGGILSSPLVHGERVYVAAAHDHAFRPYGTLYCLDRTTGQELWRFPDAKSKVRMKQIFSSPVVADGRLYIGEGFHQDFDCKVYCLDAATGEPLWDFLAGSHTESTAAIADGKLYMGAGDDGLYCLDVAKKGETLWNFPGFHIDAPPLVAGGRVYAGCGAGDEIKNFAVVCLDAKSGKPVWRMDTTLPVWGRPVVADGSVYVGSGNGRVNEGAEKPAGEVLCLSAADGEVLWRKKFGDGILGSLVADGQHVYFGCRDGKLYGLRRDDGSRAWRRELGGPVVMTPALGQGRLYAGGIEGRFVCVDPATGGLIWARDLSALANSRVEVVASPALEDGPEVRRLYVGVTLLSAGRVGELYCLEDRVRAEE